MVNPKRCKFYVNKDKRTVVCVIPNTRSDFMDYIGSMGRDNQDFSWLYYAMYKWSYPMPHSFHGKAVCSEEDEWNEELGKKIAYSRARDKYYKSFFNKASTLIKDCDTHMDRIVESFNNFGMKLEYRRNQLQNEIKESFKD